LNNNMHPCTKSERGKQIRPSDRFHRADDLVIHKENVDGSPASGHRFLLLQ
jgi:hypothetical protein